MSGRPLDVLEAAVGDDVEVHLKSGETYRGTLAGYDQHMNLVLDDVETAATDAASDSSADSSVAEDSPADDASDDATQEETVSDETPGTPETDDGPAGNGRDTTIIRGDNVVSITP